MPVKATFEEEIMVMTLTSPVSVAELMAGYEGILQDELFEPNMHAIWDLSELNLKVIPISDVRQLPRQLNQYMTRRGQGFKAALVRLSTVAGLPGNPEAHPWQYSLSTVQVHGRSPGVDQIVTIKSIRMLILSLVLCLAGHLSATEAVVPDGVPSGGDDAPAAAPETQGDPIEAMMSLWDYNNPRQSEVLFASLVEEARASGNPDYLPALLSQVARTWSLRGNLDAAHRQLDDVMPLLNDGPGRGRCFYLLERGRTFNSGGKKDQAITLFETAYRDALEIGDDYLAVDAAHMGGIAAPLGEQQTWHERAFKIAEASASESARAWLGTLYNNMGWTKFDQGQYDEALVLFQKGVEFRRERGQTRREQIARWAVGRTLRALGRLPEALAIQMRLMDGTQSMGEAPDGRVVEEIAEILHLQKDPNATRFFDQAYRLLSTELWLVENEPERIARLQRLGAPSAAVSGP